MSRRRGPRGAAPSEAPRAETAQRRHKQAQLGYGAAHTGKPPFFVVTHTAPDKIRLGLDFTFATDGLSAALSRAQRAAGDKDVVIMGGADVVRQSADAGLVDVLSLHLAPVLLGAGTPLFPGVTPRRFVQTSVRPSAYATHLTYEPAR